MKAAAVSVPFVLHLERDGPGQSGDAIDSLRSELRTAITGASKHNGDIGAFVAAASRQLKEAREKELAPPASESEAANMEAMYAFFEARAQIKPKSNGHFGTDDHWLSELVESYDFAHSISTAALSKLGLTLPGVKLNASFGDALDGGSAHRDSAPATLFEDIKLVLPKHGFERDALFAVPYVLAHEFVCHAAQGAMGPPTRQQIDPSCFWTEGWMDCLAVELVREALEGVDPKAPKWIADHRLAVRDASRREHMKRFNYHDADDKLTETDFSLRRQAAQAFDGLGLLGGEELRQAFSIRYNAHKVPAEARAGLVLGIFRHLRGPGGKSDQTIEKIKEFTEGGDLPSLHRGVSL
jgi:hypothetical protein